MGVTDGATAVPAPATTSFGAAARVADWIAAPPPADPAAAGDAGALFAVSFDAATDALRVSEPPPLSEPATIRAIRSDAAAPRIARCGRLTTSAGMRTVRARRRGNPAATRAS